MSVYSYRIICARVCKCVWVCVCVSGALLKQMKDILMTWTAASGGGLRRLINIDVFFLFCFVFFDYACMYEEYLHGLTSSLTGGQTLVKHVPLHPSSTSSTS